MDIQAVRIEIPDDCNLVLGQAHFIKTAEDLYEIIATTIPQAQFGLAFSEASGPCLLRTEGNDSQLIDTCVSYLQALEQDMCSCILLKNAFPITY